MINAPFLTINFNEGVVRDANTHARRVFFHEDAIRNGFSRDTGRALCSSGKEARDEEPTRKVDSDQVT